MWYEYTLAASIQASWLASVFCICAKLIVLLTVHSFAFISPTSLYSRVRMFDAPHSPGNPQATATEADFFENFSNTRATTKFSCSSLYVRVCLSRMVI